MSFDSIYILFLFLNRGNLFIFKSTTKFVTEAIFVGQSKPPTRDRGRGTPYNCVERGIEITFGFILGINDM